MLSVSGRFLFVFDLHLHIFCRFCPACEFVLFADLDVVLILCVRVGFHLHR